MLAIEAASPIADLSLAASLYSSCGKLAVKITSLSDDRATVTVPELPACGSFAFLVRNGVKLPTRVAWRDGGRIGLDFEEPLADDWREEAFRRNFRSSDLIA